MPGAPIKVEIGGFASVNPTSRRRRVGGKKQRAEQDFMNGAENSVLEEGQRVSEQHGLYDD